MQKRVAPDFRLAAFNCPACDAFAQIKWDRLALVGSPFGLPVHQATCISCKRPSYWLESVSSIGAEQGTIIYPRTARAPFAHPDMPESVAGDYEEARNVAVVSPRGASALLRVCIEKLCVALGAEGTNLNTKIGWLVKEKGLPTRAQQALDSVRVIGNNAVHPGMMDAEDVAGVCDGLFALVNLIVEECITRPRTVETIFNNLPGGARDAIERRDSGK